MKYTGIAAVLVACSMLLAGCGGEKQNAPSPAPAAGEKAATSTELADDVAMTVGDVSVSRGIFKMNYMGISRNSADDETAAEDTVKELSEQFGITAVAHAMGVEISEDDKKEIADYIEQMKSDYNSYEDGGFEKFLENNFITEDDIEPILATEYYAQALQDKAGEKEFSEDELKDFFKNSYRRAKHILISTETVSDEEAKAKAEELLEKAKNGEDFDKLIEENSEDPGSASYPDGYVFTDNEMVREFQDGVDSINPGEFTLVKTAYGYHVIQRLELDDSSYDENAVSVSSAAQEKYFNDQVEQWKTEYGIETVKNEKVIDEIVQEAQENQESEGE